MTPGVFLKDFAIFIQQKFQLKILFHNSGASSNCHVCIHRTWQAKTKMDNITTGSDTLLCLSAVQPHSVAMEVFPAQVFASEFTNQTSTAWGFCIEISIPGRWQQDVPAQFPQGFHSFTLRSTQRAQGTGVSARTNSEPTLTDAVCFKSLLHIWTWTLSGCLCFNSLRTELTLEGGTYTSCRQSWSTSWHTQG